MNDKLARLIAKSEIINQEIADTIKERNHLLEAIREAIFKERNLMSEKIKTKQFEDKIKAYEEEINALIRSLQRNKEFGLYFVQCQTQSNNNITSEIIKNLTDKSIREKHFLSVTNSLYNEVKSIKSIEDADILIISGLEQSVLEYERQQFGCDSLSTDQDLSKERIGLPRFIGDINLRRDTFRDNFSHLCWVFLLPEFALNYFINRAPDFFDWRSGLFLLD